LEQGFIINGWRVVPVLNCLEQGTRQRHLKPRSMEVLVKLASAGGDVVTRQELMAGVWGRSVVTEDVLTQSIVEIRKAFGDDARHPQVIETIRKVGFRLISEIEPIDSESEGGPRPASSSDGRRTGWRWAAAAIAGLLIATAIWMWTPREHSTGQLVTNDHSVAVMPFMNLSADPADEYFSHGLTEELLNALARIPGLRVPARTSSFALAGQDLDAREIGDRLGVSKILEGSVRQSGSRIRVTAQLIDTRTGFHLWSETWDRDLHDIFIIQDEISAAIAEMLLSDHLGAELQSASSPDTNSIEAYDYYLLGRHYQALGQSGRARERFKRAVQADPAYARAYAGLAESYLAFREVPSSFWQADTPDYHQALGLAEEAVETALQLDPTLVDALLARAQLMMTQLDCETAGSVFNQALSIEPSSARALHQMARYLTVDGQFDAALEQFAKAQDLDPLNPQLISDLSRLYARMGLYQEANALLLQLIDSGIQSPVVFETLMLNAEDFGRYDERIRWGRELVRLVPTRASALAELGDAYTLIGLLDVADQWISKAETFSEAQAYKARQRWLWVQRRDEEFLELANRTMQQTASTDDTILSPAQSATLGIGAIAKIQAGNPEVAALYVERYVRGSPTLPYRGIHRFLYTQTVLAIAQRASGQERAAEATIRQSLERGLEAEQQTKADYPPLLRQIAVLHALGGDFDSAMAYTHRAVDSGWRAWALEGRKPGDDPNWHTFTDRVEYLQLESAVEADIERMRAKVEQTYTPHYWNEELEPFAHAGQ